MFTLERAWVRHRAVVTTAVLVLLGLSCAAPAVAGQKHDLTDINGGVLIAAGNATAVAACASAAVAGAAVSSAEVCDNASVAEAGTVFVDRVRVRIKGARHLPQRIDGAALVVTGGDATATAACVVAAATDDDAVQAQTCTNTALAFGGSVTLRNVRVVVVLADSKGSAGTPMTLPEIVISGGSATALAACLTAAKASDASQENQCSNFAVADAGSVTLENVRFRIERAKASGASPPSVMVTGGDAATFAACLSTTDSQADASQANECTTLASAFGGDLVLEKVRISIYDSGVPMHRRDQGGVALGGGSAAALAACVAAAWVAADAVQYNGCDNTSVAIGGSLVLRNVKVLVYQAG